MNPAVSTNLIGVYIAAYQRNYFFSTIQKKILEFFHKRDADAVRVVHEGYKQIGKVLMSIAENTEQPHEVIYTEKRNTYNFFYQPKFGVERMDKTSNYLLTERITMDVVTNLSTA